MFTAEYSSPIRQWWWCLPIKVSVCQTLKTRKCVQEWFERYLLSCLVSGPVQSQNSALHNSSWWFRERGKRNRRKTTEKNSTQASWLSFGLNWKLILLHQNRNRNRKEEIKKARLTKGNWAEYIDQNNSGCSVQYLALVGKSTISLCFRKCSIRLQTKVTN